MKSKGQKLSWPCESHSCVTCVCRGLVEPVWRHAGGEVVAFGTQKTIASEGRNAIASRASSLVRLEAIATTMEAIASRLEATVTTSKMFFNL